MLVGMKRNTSVEIGSELGSFIDSQLAAGRYGSASEVIRAGVRLLQDQETKMASLRAELQEGLASGPAQDFDMAKFVQKRQSRRNA